MRTFLSDGFEALESKKSPGPPRKLTEAILEHLKQEVRQPDGSFQGTWSEPNNHYGTVTARRSGRNISTDWVCNGDCKGKKGKATWVRK